MPALAELGCDTSEKVAKGSFGGARERPRWYDMVRHELAPQVPTMRQIIE